MSYRPIMTRTIAIDFETFYSAKLKYTLRTMIAETYVKHTLFDPYLLSVCDGESTWVGAPRDFNWAALDGAHVIAHNAYFDWQVWCEMARRGWCPIPRPASVNCTANLAAYVGNRRSLDQAVEFLFGVKLSKAIRSKAEGQTWKDFSPEDQKAMEEYARRDAFWCHKLWIYYSPKWPVSEQRLSWQTIQQGIKGLQIDVNLLNNFLIQTHEARENTTKLIPWIAEAEEDETAWEGFNTKPTSTKCIAEQCRRVGIPCPPVKADDEDAFAAWEETYSPKHPWIGALTAWRSLNKLYKTCETIKSRLRPDNTVPFELKYFGAETGRWAGGAKWNLQNMKRLPTIIRQDGLMEQDDLVIDGLVKSRKANKGVWGSTVRHAIDLRNLIIPRPGKKLISCDLSQIEPRVLAWLTGDTATLDLLRGGMSIYEIHARLTMGWTGGKLKDEDPVRYDLSKARVLSLGYGAGWKKFIVMARNVGIDITKDDPEWIMTRNPVTGEMKQVSGYGSFSQSVVKDFRERNLKTTAIWNKLDSALKCSIGGDFEMTLPSGRVIRYKDVRASVTIEPDPETGKPRRKNVVTVAIGGVRYSIYGGMLTAHVTSSTARDVFAYHLLKLEDAGLPPLFTCHDEAIVETDVDNGVAVDDIARIMSTTPPWLEKCPIAAEAKEIPYYQK